MPRVKKEAVHVGYGVRLRRRDDRLCITVPCNKRWRGGLFLLLYLGFLALSRGYFLVFALWPGWLDLIRLGEMRGATLGHALGITAVWLLLAGAVIGGALWFLLGQYVLEIGSKTVRVGRALFDYEFLGTHEAVGLRRIRFSPTLNPGRGALIRTKWNTSGKVYRQGHYTLHLDYGHQQREVLRMAVEESQVRLIKGIIREHCPHWYDSKGQLDVAAPGIKLSKEKLFFK